MAFASPVRMSFRPVPMTPSTVFKVMMSPEASPVLVWVAVARLIVTASVEAE